MQGTLKNSGLELRIRGGHGSVFKENQTICVLGRTEPNLWFG